MREPFIPLRRDPDFADAMARAEAAAEPKPSLPRYRRGTFGLVDQHEHRILSKQEAALIDPGLIEP